MLPLYTISDQIEQLDEFDAQSGLQIRTGQHQQETDEDVVEQIVHQLSQIQLFTIGRAVTDVHRALDRTGTDQVEREHVEKHLRNQREKDAEQSFELIGTDKERTGKTDLDPFGENDEADDGDPGQTGPKQEDDDDQYDAQEELIDEKAVCLHIFSYRR